MKATNSKNNVPGVGCDDLVRPFLSLSDEDLFDAIREQVNLSRVTGKHDRTKTRQLAKEANLRGWNLRTNS